MKLSILIPLFNEEKTIKTVIKRLEQFSIDNLKKEVIIIDDGSTDSSVLEIKKAKTKNIKLIRHKENKGKGEAIKLGIQKATGDYILIQDADLEYHPRHIKRLFEPIFKNKASVVYGTRLKRLPNFSKDERSVRFFIHYLGNRILSLITSILYGQWITDMETGYKLFPNASVMDMKLNSHGFEFEAEITAKLIKKGYHIVEVPISTNPRGYDEGKKLRTVQDGTKALWTILKYRFTD